MGFGNGLATLRLAAFFVGILIAASPPAQAMINNGMNASNVLGQANFTSNGAA